MENLAEELRRAGLSETSMRAVVQTCGTRVELRDIPEAREHREAYSTKKMYANCS
jgi:hypothetical protein